jgi:cobalt-zinc-cadmium efflux system membrane fusion protein
MQHNLRSILRTLSAACIILLGSCSGKTAEEKLTKSTSAPAGEHTVNFTEEQYTTAGIELGGLEKRFISGTIEVNGRLDVPPQQMVSIGVPLGGFLKNTPLLQGSRVKKGQIIATIENLDFIQLQQDYLEAKSQLEFAQADYERQQELGKENVNSQKALQQSKATFQGWQAKLNGLREKLKVMNIDLAALESGKISSTINLYSPINGYVTQVNVNIGRFVNPTDILFEIVNTEHLHVELTVFEKDALKLKVGQKVRFTLANETKERTATVYLLGREISEDRTVRIHCHITEEDTNLLPGMYLQAIVETGGSEVIALPDGAIIDYLGRKYVFYREAAPPESAASTNSYSFNMHEVQVGISEAGYTEVNLPADFPASAQIVVNNAYSILSQLRNMDEGE